MRGYFSDLLEDALREIVKDVGDGTYEVDQSYFNYATGLTMTTEKFHRLFGAPPRTSETVLTQREMDLAASVQKVTEEVMLRMTRDLAKTYGPALEAHPNFPNRTNVSFVRKIDAHTIDVRFWERGAGETNSSGTGSTGAATAAGLVAFSIGSETLGSIVSPSMRCGLTGLRPTFGRVPKTGAMALSWTMDKIGPICRSVADCAEVAHVQSVRARWQRKDLDILRTDEESAQ